MMQRYCCWFTGTVAVMIGAGCESGTPGNPPIRTAGAVAESDDVAAAGDQGTFTVQFTTSAGDFTIEVHRSWAPRGAQRFYELVRSGFYDDCRFFRAIPGFMVQFGMSGTPSENAKWRRILDDRVVKSNKRRYVTFAMGGPNSRTTQIFINYGDNSRLDRDGFAPFGEVVAGMDTVDAINGEYGGLPGNRQGEIGKSGNAFLDREFPNLDRVNTARIIKKDGKPVESTASVEQ